MITFGLLYLSHNCVNSPVYTVLHFTCNRRVIIVETRLPISSECLLKYDMVKPNVYILCFVKYISEYLGIILFALYIFL